MKVIFEHEGLLVLQDVNGAIVLETLTAPNSMVSVRKHMPAGPAMEMTAAINTACFPFQASARVADEAVL